MARHLAILHQTGNKHIDYQPFNLTNITALEQAALIRKHL
jgi:hypothetical protein